LNSALAPLDPRPHPRTDEQEDVEHRDRYEGSIKQILERLAALPAGDAVVAVLFHRDQCQQERDGELDEQHSPEAGNPPLNVHSPAQASHLGAGLGQRGREAVRSGLDDLGYAPELHRV
jgi:hypothetical protein